MRQFLSIFISLLLPLAAHAATARISHLDGTATWESVGREPVPLKANDSVMEGATVKTGAQSRMELAMPDGSAVRLGPDSQMTLARSYFQEEKRDFSFKLAAGKLWARVRSAVSGAGGDFKVETPTAVCAVRGTTYAVEVGGDFATALKVYSGKVGVKPVYQTHAPGKGPRREVAGPQEVAGPEEVSVEEWSRIVESGQMVLVDAKSSAGKTSKFDMAADSQDPWVEWNMSRDGAKQP